MMGGGRCAQAGRRSSRCGAGVRRRGVAVGGGGRRVVALLLWVSREPRAEDGGPRDGAAVAGGGGRLEREARWQQLEEPIDLHKLGLHLREGVGHLDDDANHEAEGAARVDDRPQREHVQKGRAVLAVVEQPHVHLGRGLHRAADGVDHRGVRLLALQEAAVAAHDLVV